MSKKRAIQSCVHTGPSWDVFYMGDESDKFHAPLALYHYSSSLLDPALKKLQIPFRKEKLTVDECLSTLRIIGDPIGKGQYGVAYRCEYREMGYVIKLPRKAIESKIITIENGKVHYDEYDQDHDTKNRQIKNNAVSIFNLEFKNAERMLDPPGYAANSMAYTDFETLTAELKRMKMHPGYSHLHKIEHYFPEVPCILSEYCNGSIFSLIKTHPFMFIIRQKSEVPPSHSMLPAAWYDVAYQVGQAMLYLRDECKIAHRDIKPDNILYKTRAGLCHCFLSDFGACSNPSRQLAFPLMIGTEWFNPPYGHFASNTCTAMQASIYSYAATLLSISNFPRVWFQPTKDEKQDVNGFYYMKSKHIGDLTCIQNIYSKPNSCKILNKFSSEAPKPEAYLFQLIMKKLMLPGLIASDIEDSFNCLQAKLIKIERIRQKHIQQKQQ